MHSFDKKGHSDKITIFLADRTTFFKQGVSAALAKYEDLEVIGESNMDSESLALVQSLSPQVILIDINPPSYNGIQMARQIAQTTDHIAIAMLTPYSDEDELVQAVTCGASAYFSRYIDDFELVNTIRRMADGALPIIDDLIANPGVLQRVLVSFRSISSKGITTNASRAPITERETEILSYAARGFGNKQIAHTLKISEQTIKNHMTSILRKLDANDRTQAVVMAMQSGWISTTAKSNRTN